MTEKLPKAIRVSEAMIGKRVVIEQSIRLANGLVSDPEVFTRYVLEVAEKASSIHVNGHDFESYHPEDEWLQITARSTEKPYSIVIDILSAHENGG